MASTEREILRTELGWAVVVAGVVGVIMAAILYAALARHINPPSNVEFVDPKTLHLSGEFTESKPRHAGRTRRRGHHSHGVGAVRLRAALRRRSAGRPVTLRFVTPDVIHGLLITGTNVNTMVVPGYVSQVRTTLEREGDLLMPCHEYCGLGHSQMWATVRVVSPEAFSPGPDGKVACDTR